MILQTKKRFKIIILILLFVFNSCMLKETTKEKKEEEKPIRPEYKQDRSVQFCYFINNTKKDHLDYLSTSLTTMIRENIEFIKKIRIPAEFQIITNKDAIVEGQKKSSNTASEKLDKVFKRTEEDFFGEFKGYNKKKEIDEVKDKSKKENKEEVKNKENNKEDRKKDRKTINDKNDKPDKSENKDNDKSENKKKSKKIR